VSPAASPTATIVEALESLDSPTPPTFAELLDRLYQMRFQGAVTLHFAGGIPRAVVLSQPKQIPLDTLGTPTGG
jgi:hypothetical protein